MYLAVIAKKGQKPYLSIKVESLVQCQKQILEALYCGITMDVRSTQQAMPLSSDFCLK